MNIRTRKVILWALYALFFLFVLLLQTIQLGNITFAGVKLSLIPVAVACIAMEQGAENGAIFALAAGTFWCFSGANGGAANILLLTASAAAVGFLCDRLLIHNVVSALLLSLLASLFCEFGLFAVSLISGILSAALFRKILLQVLFSALFSLIFAPLCRLIGKVVR